MRTAARSLVLVGYALAAFAPLAGCESVDLGTPPADVNACRPGQQFFVDQIWPNFLDRDYGGRRCADAGCHDAPSGRFFVLLTPTAAGTVPLTGEWEANYLSAANQMNCSNVGASVLFNKPSASVPHGGQRLIDPAGAEADLIRMWVSQP
jgi:hypothetical protein